MDGFFFDCALYLSTGFCTFFKKICKKSSCSFSFSLSKKAKYACAPLEKGLFRLNSPFKAAKKAATANAPSPPPAWC